MNKKESREVIRWEAEMWEERKQKALYELETLEASSFLYNLVHQRMLEYESTEQAVLMTAKSLELITQEECERCMRDGVNSVIKPLWKQRAGGG